MINKIKFDTKSIKKDSHCTMLADIDSTYSSIHDHPYNIYCIWHCMAHCIHFLAKGPISSSSGWFLSLKCKHKSISSSPVHNLKTKHYVSPSSSSSPSPSSSSSDEELYSRPRRWAGLSLVHKTEACNCNWLL